MPASATRCAFTTNRHAQASSAVLTASLKAVRVLADPGDDQASAVDALQDGDNVKREDADPGEDQQQAEHASEAERGEAHEARETP